MNTYEQKQLARKERLLARAEAAEKKAKGARASSDKISSVIPMGQPVLVGHHSEKRHRRDLEKIRRGHERALEESSHAEGLRRRAASVGKTGISADDPGAIEKLQEKLNALEEKREAFKEHNKKAKAEGQEILPRYVLTNLGARIRQTKQRIAGLKAQAQEVERPPVEIGDWTIREDCEDNRILLEHDGKPPADVRAALKRAGFRWSPTRSAWVRQLNNGARHAAERVLREIVRSD